MKIGLETVQFGQNYGVSNKQGITTEEIIKTIDNLNSSKHFDFFEYAVADESMISPYLWEV